MFRNQITLFALLFLAIQPADPQTSVHGALYGRVLDPQGLPVPGAEILAIETSLGRSLTASSDESGRFAFPRLSPGGYDVRASKDGFRTVRLEGITVNVNAAAALTLRLELGDVSEEVTVSVDAPVVDASSSDISLLVERRPIEALPLNGKNFQQLVYLTPGVAGLDRFGSAPNNPAVSGARPTHNSYAIDGVGSNDERLTTGFVGVNQSSTDLDPTTPNIVPSESIAEFRIVTSNADATFGRSSGGQINIITRSGGNDLHGSGYWFLRNDALDARDFFNTGPFFNERGEAVTPPFKQNVFGASIGGPLVRNRHFFFANYEGLRQRRQDQTAGNDIVPSRDLISLMPGELGRFFRAFYVDRGAVPETASAGGAFTALPEADRLAAVGAGFPADLFDGSPGNGEAGTVLVSTAPRNDIDQDALTVRTDHALTDSLSASVRYLVADSLVERGAGAIARDITVGDRRIHSGAAQLVWTPSADQVVELRGGLLRSSFLQAPGGGIDPALTALGVSPEFGIQVRTNGASFRPNLGGEFVDNQTTPQLSFLHSWQRGSLTLRSGMDLRLVDINVRNIFSAQPIFRFEGVVGPNALLGVDPAQPEAVAASASQAVFTAGPTTSLRGFRSTHQEYFTQADWRLHPHVTLNLGLRYSYFSPYQETNGFLSNLYAADDRGLPVPGVSPFAFGRTQNVVAPVSDDLRFYQPDRNNFQPRAGLAWNLGGRDSTILRVGYGVYFDRLIQLQWSGVVTNPPFAAAGNIADAPFRLGGFVPIEPGSTPSVTGVTPDLVNPYTLRHNFAVEQRLGDRSSMTVAYVGARGRKLFSTERPNAHGGVPQDLRPDPRYSTLSIVSNGSFSEYHALQVLAKRAYAKGFSMTAAYTWGRAQDDLSDELFYTLPSLINLGADPAPGFQGGGPDGWAPAPRQADFSYADFDIRHSLAVSFVYDSPLRGGTWGALLGGWTVSGIVTARSGQRENVRLGSDANDDGTGSRDRPGLIRGSLDDLYSGGRFDKTQYMLPQADAQQFLAAPLPVTDPFAQIPRNAVHGPALYAFDLSLARTFRLAERAGLTVEANAFNLLNRANLANPIGNVGSGLFGRIRSTRPGSTPRQIQLGLRLRF